MTMPHDQEFAEAIRQLAIKAETEEQTVKEVFIEMTVLITALLEQDEGTGRAPGLQLIGWWRPRRWWHRRGGWRRWRHSQGLTTGRAA